MKVVRRAISRISPVFKIILFYRFKLMNNKNIISEYFFNTVLISNVKNRDYTHLNDKPIIFNGTTIS